MAGFVLGKESGKREVLAGSQPRDLPRRSRHVRRRMGERNQDAQAHYVVDRGADDGADYVVRERGGVCRSCDPS
jgi:hypothetical protein